MKMIMKRKRKGKGKMKMKMKKKMERKGIDYEDQLNGIGSGLMDGWNNLLLEDESTK
ncbi:hypothetical protein A2U01_0071385 [Trifolium medium]|uniref:Uncharacterized protein n=1 Tax=Trifolium medium TaxID=97028 RepID=A0A392SMN2_9FABA|nr:hypothetical protein [Trifolium medium]